MGDAAGAVVAGAAGAVVVAAGAALAAGDALPAGILSRTEPEDGRRIVSARLVTMKRPARIVVARERTLAEPRGPKAVWVPPPPKALARSWPFPCWSSTTPIRKKHAMMCRTTTR